MQKETLDQTHPDYDSERWDELVALAKGGKRFHALISKFLPQNPMEPELRYGMRKKRARYYSYSGMIINLYASWLFAAGFEAKPYKVGTTESLHVTDQFYGDFQENVGGECTLKTFMKDRFRTAMTTGRAVWVAEIPQVDPEYTPPDRATWEKLGLGRARLREISPDALLDWECDDDGQLVWCIVKTTTCERLSFDSKRDWCTEQWRIYTRDEVTLYELTYEKAKPPAKTDIATNKGTTRHGFKRVPVMRLSLPEELCIGEQTSDAQISHFQADAGLQWAIAQSCYPTPVFNIVDDENKPTMGIGYAIYLGENETLSYAAPPSDAFDTMAKNRDSKRDEIFRIVHQMAQGLDNNAETVGRSADSKEIDAAATRIMLNAYGEIVGKAIEETFELVSEMRGDEDYEWSVEGFSGYDTATVSSLIANAHEAKGLGIPSNTFQREVTKKAALAIVPELDPRVKALIRSEIDEYDFTVTGELIEQVIAEAKAASMEKIADTNTKSAEKQTVMTTKSAEKQTTASLKTQEKTAAAAAKAKAAAPKAAAKKK